MMQRSEKNAAGFVSSIGTLVAAFSFTTVVAVVLGIGSPALAASAAKESAPKESTPKVSVPKSSASKESDQEGVALSGSESVEAGGQIEITITNLRSKQGHVAINVFPKSAKEAFPGDSTKAVATFYESVDGREEITVRTKALEEGEYAVAVMHDEDSNRKLASVLGAPREGFGFSNNPRIYFGPPSFEKARVDVKKDGEEKVEIQMKYML